MKKIILLLLVIMIMLPVFIFSAKVVVRVPQDPDFLDPHKAAASGTEEMMFNVFEGLLKADSNGNVVPAVAERYSVSPDGLVYTFKLRKGIKFHNGALVTVDDIIYSLDRLRGVNNEKPLSSTFSSFIKDVKATDKETVVVSMKELNTSFITNFTVAIIPKNNTDPNKNPIGTGPFKFKEYLPGQRVVIQKFNDYWKKGVPMIDEVEFRIITDDQAALLALLSGEIDMSPRIDVLQLDLLSDNFQVIKSEQNMVQLLALNHQNKYFSDVRVRQAINYAVDKDEIINAVALGYGTKLGSNMSPVMKKYYREGLEDYYQTNITKAKELLRQAGYPNGFRTTITVPSNYKFHVDTAQVIVEQLKKIGIIAEIEQVEWGVWLERVYANRKYESTIIGLTGKLSAYDILKRYVSDFSRNFYNYSNPMYDEIIRKAVKETDDAKATELYKQAQDILTKDAVAVYIMDPNFINAMKKEIGGYTVYPLYIQDMSVIYIAK